MDAVLTFRKSVQFKNQHESPLCWNWNLPLSCFFVFFRWLLIYRCSVISPCMCVCVCGRFMFLWCTFRIYDADPANESQTHSYGPIPTCSHSTHKTHATPAVSKGFDVIFIHNEFLGKSMPPEWTFNDCGGTKDKCTVK